MRTPAAVGRAIGSAVAVICYVDSSVVMYYIENPPRWGLAAVFDRAAAIRAHHSVKPLDALHLAAASEARCDIFLTNDQRLRSVPGLAVEVLA